jgi:hypothetical protein
MAGVRKTMKNDAKKDVNPQSGPVDSDLDFEDLFVPTPEQEKERYDILDEELNSEKKKARRGTMALVGIAATIFGLISIAYSLLSSFNTSAVINPVTDKNIHVDVTIQSSQFKSGSNNSICAGSGALAGISTATLNLTQSSSGLDLHSKLGNGILTQNGSCLYSIVLSPPAGFTGGNVTESVTFPFGQAPETKADLGNQPPFNHFPITINLS